MVGKNVVLSAEDLHGLLGVFLQLKQHSKENIVFSACLLLERPNDLSSCGIPGPPEDECSIPEKFLWLNHYPGMQ